MILAGSAIASPTGAGKYHLQGDYPDPDWQHADITVLDCSYQANDIPSSSPPASVTSGALPHNHGIGGGIITSYAGDGEIASGHGKIKSEFDERLRVTRHPAEENMISQGNKITTPAALSNIPQLYHIIFQYVDQGANLRYPKISSVKEEERTAGCIREGIQATQICYKFLSKLRRAVMEHSAFIAPDARSWIQKASERARLTWNHYKHGKMTHSCHRNGKGRGAGSSGSSK
ncbi:hypothetical protein C8R48DRAFT_782402 [Suillus tomentosus]|nr:hypothetical protein C8R48DRAFT_782402 [Suillus tomentosus]